MVLLLALLSWQVTWHNIDGVAIGPVVMAGDVAQY
jgi:hypothetical protein